MDEIDESAKPKSLKNLRACRVCLLVKDVHQFEDNGCENCINVWNPENVYDFVTPHFSGYAHLLP